METKERDFTDKEMVKDLVVEEARNYKDCEEARQSMLNRCNTVRSLQVTVDESLWESLKDKNDVRSQLLGKRIFAEVNAFIARYPVLKESVGRGVDLRDLSFDEGEAQQVQEESGAPELLQRDVENFQRKMEAEKKEVVKMLSNFSGSPDNKQENINQIWAQMSGMQVDPDIYCTDILRGGLVQTGRLTRNVIEKFNALQKRKNVCERSFSLQFTAEVKRVTEELEELEAEFYNDIWGLEDATSKFIYLNKKCVPTQTDEQLGTLTRDKSRKTEKRGEEVDQFWGEVIEAIECKWDRRQILAARIMNLQGRKQVPVVMDQSLGRNIKAIILQGYIDVSTEICAKIAKVANVQIRGQLNKPTEGSTDAEYNALDKRSLNGVMRALEQEYKHAPVTMVFHSLREMYADRGERSYLKCAKWIDNQVSLWAELDLFSYLVPDLLFTMMEIHQMPKGTVRDRCYQAVLDKMREAPADYHPDKIKGRRDIRVLPLRRVVMDVIRDSATVNGESEESAEPMKKAWKSFVPKQPVVQGSTPAMKASVEGEVTVDDQQWIQVKGKNLSYTSTASRCEKCLSDDEAAHHRPRCFLYQCHQCQMWGHRVKSCQNQKK